MVDDLDREFTTDWYDSAGVATGQANGTTTPPTGIKGSVSAPPPPSTYIFARDYVYGLSPGTTYTLYGYAQAGNGSYYPAGSATFATLADNPRPSNFSWTYPKVSGGNFNLTATEWNSFTARINAFRTYKSIGSYSFTSAISGNSFTATMFNQARTAISAMNSSVPSAVSSGGTVYASGLNSLVSALNAIS